MINKIEFLYIVKSDIDNFLSGKSNFIFYGDSNCFFMDEDKVFICYNNEYEKFILSIVHEIFHHYQDLSKIRDLYPYRDDYKSLLDDRVFPIFEIEADLFSYRYFYFMLERNCIDGDFAKSSLHKEYAVSFFDIDDFNKNNWLFSFSLSFNTEGLDKVWSDNSKLVSFKNERGEDVAHFSYKKCGHLWFGFHNGEDWVDLIYPYFFTNGFRDITFYVTDQRDYFQRYDVEYSVCSYYKEENKPYFKAIHKVVIEQPKIVSGVLLKKRIDNPCMTKSISSNSDLKKTT